MGKPQFAAFVTECRRGIYLLFHVCQTSGVTSSARPTDAPGKLRPLRTLPAAVRVPQVLFTSPRNLTRLPAQTEDLSVSVTLMFGPRGGGLRKGKVACHPRCPGFGTAGPVVPGMPDPSADLGAGLVGGTSGFPEFLPVDSDV